jgi:hypothetical protein
MDEKAMTEQDLMEEQLQQITGGCGVCDWNRSERDKFLDKAANYRWLAEARAAQGLRADARDAAIEARIATRWAKEHHQVLAEIPAIYHRDTAGHPPAGEGSSNAVPDLNRLRLH